MSDYSNAINKTHPVVLRAAGHHQTDTGLLWTPPAFSSRFASDRPFTTQRGGVCIKRFELHNRSGGSASVGIGCRLANRYWIMGRFAANGSAYTDLTSSAQSTGTVTLQVAGADQTGFIIGCQVPFDWASINITTAETNAGGATVVDHTMQYSNAAGTGWTSVSADSVTTDDDLIAANTVYAAQAQNFVWNKPTDWGAWTSTVLPTGYYYLRFDSAEREALDVAAVATGIEIGKLLSIEALADNGVWEMEAVDYWEPKGDGLVAYFSVANAGNRAYIEVASR